MRNSPKSETNLLIDGKKWTSAQYFFVVSLISNPKRPKEKVNVIQSKKFKALQVGLASAFSDSFFEKEVRTLSRYS